MSCEAKESLATHVDQIIDKILVSQQIIKLRTMAQLLCNLN